MLPKVIQLEKGGEVGVFGKTNVMWRRFQTGLADLSY
jgi:hypothetical protein